MYLHDRMYPSANSDQTNQLLLPAVIPSKRTKTLQKSIKVLKSVLFVLVHPTLYDLNWYKTLMDWKHCIILFIPFISQSEFINSFHTRKILYFSHLFFLPLLISFRSVRDDALETLEDQKLSSASQNIR